MEQKRGNEPVCFRGVSKVLKTKKKNNNNHNQNHILTGKKSKDIEPSVNCMHANKRKTYRRSHLYSIWIDKSRVILPLIYRAIIT